MALHSVLIIGAGGYIGSPVAHEFLKQKDSFSRVAILADASKVSKFSAIQEAGMEIVVGSFTDPKSYEGFDTVISLIGNHAMKLQPAMVDAALAAGVQDFYPSEYGSDISQGGYLTNRYFRDKHITRSHLAKVAHSNPKFNYTLIIVGGFMEYAVEELFGVNTKEHTFNFYGSPGKQEPLTATLDVAKIIVATTLLPKSPTQVREFRNPTGLYSWSEIVATISKAQGVEYDCFYHPVEDARALQAKYAASDDTDLELAYSLKSLMGDADHLGIPKPWSENVFNWQRISLESAMKTLFSKAAEI